MAFEIRVDCASCSVEGTRIETWDSDSPLGLRGVPESVVCRFCGHAAEGVMGPAGQAGLEERAPPGPPRDEAAILGVLERWARDEGLASAQDLVDAYFVLPTTAEVVAALLRGEKIETTFDVADYLFSGGAAGGGATAGPSIMRDEAEAPRTQRVPKPISIQRLGGPRDELLALAAVAAADGEASPDDKQALARAADKRGIPRLDVDDVRVRRPNEIDPPPTLVDRERVLEEMFQMAWSDGQLDESEMRVIREFSRAWGIDPARLTEWTELYSFGESGAIERWFRRVGFFLFPAR